MKFDHYIALDWAQKNMAVARMSAKSEKIHAMDVPSDLGNLKDYLKSLKGSKILTFEETTTAQWLYTELSPLVDETCICDPYRNKLLSEGAKTDLIDASKLVQLLRANLLKPVFHSNDRLIDLRKLVSGYQDLIEQGVRLKNQRSAQLRAQGLGKKSKTITGDYEKFVFEKTEKAIDQYERDRKEYQEQMLKVAKKLQTIKNLKGIPGIGIVGAIKVASIVVTPDRFISNNHYLSYCGLIRLAKMSGGRNYGYKTPRHRRDLKAVFKTAALSAITHEGGFKNYYEYLMMEKQYPPHKARHAVARKIAIAAKGVMSNGRKWDPIKIGVIREIKK